MRQLLLSLLPCLLTAQAAPEPAHIVSFQTTARTVARGGTVTLRWSATGTDKVRLEPLGLILPAKGELTHLVTGRIVYWLHVANAAGGQSVPLVVDLLPEAPARALPAGPLLTPSALAPDLPRMAEKPRIQLPQPPQAAEPPAAVPVSSHRRVARHHLPRQIWIQLAATHTVRGAARLQRTLQRVANLDSTLMVRNRRSGHTFQLIRTGPFPSVQAAHQRMQELASAMQTLKIKPLIVFGPAPATNFGTTYLADARQPG